MTASIPPASAPPRKSKAGLIIGIIAGVVLLICVGVVGVIFTFGAWFTTKAEETLNEAIAQASLEPALPDDGNSKGNGSGASHTVRYEVDGTGEAFLNWGKGTGGQDSKITSLPFSIEITVNADHFGTIVSAVPRGKDTAIKSCRILVDGKEIKHAEATTGFVACTATYLGNP